MFPKKAKPTGPSGWCFAEQCRGWQRRGKLTGAIRGSSFRKPKNIAYLHFTMWFTMFFYMFYWGKWRWAMNQDVQKSQFHGLFLEPGFGSSYRVWPEEVLNLVLFCQYEPRFLASTSDFSGLFSQPPPPKAQQILIFPSLFQGFFARVFMPFFVEFLPEVLVLRRAGNPQGDTELRRVGRREGTGWRYHPDAPCGTLW